MSLTVDERLLRGMARDAAIYALTRPVAIVMWVALTAALVLSILNLRAPGVREGISGLLPVLSIGLMLYAVVMTIAGARRAVRAATPPGTTVWVRLGETALQIGAGTRTSDIPYTTFQGLRAGRDAVIFRISGSTAVTAVPRSLVSDEDIARLRSLIG
ncbi:YcxB family protein [Microbacterium sp.]|uniref:YcxB family protein n=1 Tax=Microbacterium sp. TaxID=51671 RepID=UPI00356972F5